MSDEKPGMAARLGQVFDWTGRGLAVLAAFVAFFCLFPRPYKDLNLSLDQGQAVMLFLAVGFGCWLIGRGARYILKGD